MNITVLDHGYVRFIEAWGHGRDGRDLKIVDENENTADDFEVGIIEAARQSTQGAFRGWDDDARLLKFLYDNKHATPFEFAGMTIEVQAPIFVFREWHRHRTQSYNEMSARYAPLPDLCYVPDPTVVEERGKIATQNRQAAAIAAFNAPYVAEWIEDVREAYALCESVYRAALENGIPKELARVTMPVGHYSRMRASANLRNWLAFLTLRADPAAQWEIRQFAYAVGDVIRARFPQTWRLFNRA